MENISDKSRSDLKNNLQELPIWEAPLLNKSEWSESQAGTYASSYEGLIYHT